MLLSRAVKESTKNAGSEQEESDNGFFVPRSKGITLVIVTTRLTVSSLRDASNTIAPLGHHRRCIGPPGNTEKDSKVPTQKPQLLILDNVSITISISPHHPKHWLPTEAVEGQEQHFRLAQSTVEGIGVSGGQGGSSPPLGERLPDGDQLLISALDDGVDLVLQHQSRRAGVVSIGWRACASCMVRNDLLDV